MSLNVTKRALFEFRGQISGTKRVVFEFRGSKMKDIRTAVGGTDSPKAHTTPVEPTEAHPLRRTRFDSEGLLAPDPGDPTGGTLKTPQRPTS